MQNMKKRCFSLPFFLRFSVQFSFCFLFCFSFVLLLFVIFLYRNSNCDELFLTNVNKIEYLLFVVTQTAVYSVIRKTKYTFWCFLQCFFFFFSIKIKKTRHSIIFSPIFTLQMQYMKQLTDFAALNVIVGVVNFTYKSLQFCQFHYFGTFFLFLKNQDFLP